MTKFKPIRRYDVNLSKEGLWKSVSYEDIFIGKFKVKGYDPVSPFFKVERERYSRKHKATIDTLKDQQLKNIHQFVHMAMVDWEGIVDENDKEVVFSKDLAYEFLTQDDDPASIGLFTFGELFDFATTMSNFRASDEVGDETALESVDEVTKN